MRASPPSHSSASEDLWVHWLSDICELIAKLNLYGDEDASVVTSVRRVAESVTTEFTTAVPENYEWEWIIWQRFSYKSLPKEYTRGKITRCLDQLRKGRVILRYYKYNVKLFIHCDFEKFETIERDSEILLKVFPAYDVLCLFACLHNPSWHKRTYVLKNYHADSKSTTIPDRDIS